MTSDRMAITINDEPRSVFMSNGHLNEIIKLFGGDVGLNEPAELLVNPEAQTAVLRILLSVRDARGQITEEFSPWSTSIPIEEIQRLMAWVTEHTLSFFVRGLAGAQTVKEGAAYKDMMVTIQSWMQQPNGSKDSATKNP